MAENITIQKRPVLPAGMDYGLLRRSAMQYIEQMGSSLWTDYNIHDPGITIMELLSFALTDLSFRANFPIQDLLADTPDTAPYPARQGFFTARDILTVSPWTCLDYRKLLVDIDGIKNGWLFCKQCACDDMYVYADCKKSALQYDETEHKVTIHGMYDVLVEFEEIGGVGDLNSGKVKYNFSFPVGSGSQLRFANAAIEMRLPPWRELEAAGVKYSSFRNPASKVKSVKVLFISGNKGDNKNIEQVDLGSGLRKPLFATLELSYWPNAADTAFVQTLSMQDVPMLVWFHNDAERKALQLPDLAAALTDSGAAGTLPAYLSRIHAADKVMLQTRKELHAHRNLCEDYCSITSVPVQDVAVCADMDVASDADIEAILGEAYFRIAEYMSPDVKFWSLKELLDAGKTVDDIFDGPQLSNGFIDSDQLAATSLKTELRTSDIINLLMDIPGVLAIRNFSFSPFDNEGRRQAAETWVYKVPAMSQPRLYMEGSKFLVFKNGLPFLPDQLELSDTLQVVRARNAQPKYPLAEQDLPVPLGQYRSLSDYRPVQYDLPLTYGVGVYGLPSHATEARKAQAKQLKAYLMFFEQLLVNYLATLSSVKELFAIDAGVKQSYFSRLLTEKQIVGLDELYAEVEGVGLVADGLTALTETKSEFLDRRNRFLDHLLARFGEQFTDYTLMLYAYTGSKERTDETLIEDKVAFLKAFPQMSSGRGRSFDYKDAKKVCSNKNVAGLQTRIERLLGFRSMGDLWELYEEHDTDGKFYERRWRLRNELGKIILSSSTRYTDDDVDTANAKATAEIRQVAKYMPFEERYQIKKSRKWVLNLTDPSGEVIATRKQHFSKKTDAEAARDELIKFAKTMLLGEKIFIVEHLLMRPRNYPGSKIAPAGDALLPICIGPACDDLCGTEDPYSFRMTLVMSGEGGLANAGIEFRRFAERTIRFEVPAHIGLKICWVSADQMLAFQERWCAYLAELAKAAPDPSARSKCLDDLLVVFNDLKSVYPPASLHDCEDGNDENRVFLNQTVV